MLKLLRVYRKKALVSSVLQSFYKPAISAREVVSRLSEGGMKSFRMIKNTLR